MKAWVYKRYGSPDVLGFEEVDTPTPAGDEVAVRVHACGLNAADWHVMRADPFLVRLRFGLRRPRRPMIAGCDIAGVVESVGDRVTRFSPGDHVFAEVGFTGGLAELATIRETASRGCRPTARSSRRPRYRWRASRRSGRSATRAGSGPGRPCS